MKNKLQWKFVAFNSSGESDKSVTNYGVNVTVVSNSEERALEKVKSLVKRDNYILSEVMDISFWNEK